MQVNFQKQLASSIHLHALTGTQTLCTRDYTILGLSSGVATLTVNQHKFPMIFHDCALIPPGISAELDCATKVLVFLIRIPVSVLLDLDFQTTLLMKYHDSRELPALKELFPLCEKAVSTSISRPDSSRYCNGLILCALDLIETNVPAAEPVEYPDTSSKSSLAMPYLRQNFRYNISLKEIAASLHMTPEYLALSFKKKYHCTCMEQVARLRCELAYSYLTLTDSSLDHIALQCGFKNITSLTRSIQSRYQMTPDELRTCKRQSLPLSWPDERTLIDDWTPDEHVQPLYPENPSTARQKIIDFSQKKYLPTSWNRLINLGYASDFANSALRQQIDDIQNKVHFEYGRICRIFDLITEKRDGLGAYYDFETVFQTLDFILSKDLIPFLEIGNKKHDIKLNLLEATKLTLVENSKEYYAKILQILPEFIQSCCNRYGVSKINTWHFECYYEPINDRTENDLTFYQYVNYFNKIQEIIHRYAPGCRVGGSGFNSFQPPERLTAMLQTENYTPDFLSLYVYGGIDYNGKPTLTDDCSLPINRTRAVVSAVHEQFPALKIWITEFSFSYSARCFLNDSCFQSTYIARYICETMQYVHALGYYMLSDISTQYTDSDQMFFGGNGLYNCHSIPKPSFYTYRFFHHLGNTILAQGKNYLITAHSNTCFCCLFYNHAHIHTLKDSLDIGMDIFTTPEKYIEKGAVWNTDFVFPALFPGTYIIKSRILSNDSSAPVDWCINARSKQLVQKDDIDYFCHKSSPASHIYVTDLVPEEPFTLSVSLKPGETHFIEITCIKSF